MKYKSFGRSLVCLLLVCCLVFNAVSLPAKAVTGADLLWVAGEWVIASLLKGLCVECGETTEDFASTVAQIWSDIKANTEWYEWILGDSFAVMNHGTEADKQIYMVQLALLTYVRDWLFDSGTVTASAPDLSGVGSGVTEAYELCSSYGPRSF